MRILVLANNWVGWQVMEWLVQQNEQIAGLVVNPPDKRKYGDEIIQSAGVDAACVFDGSQIQRPEVFQQIKALNCDIALSILSSYILGQEFIDLFPQGVINLHPSYLPYNRGAFPNVWSIVERTPAGVTIHYIDSGVDTGDIIAQHQLSISPTDTGESLYRKLEEASFQLFTATWPRIRSGHVARIPQSGHGTYHRKIDIQEIDRIDLERTFTARELIDLIRARTFPPFPGAYFVHQGRKIYLRLQLLYEDELDKTN